MTPLFIVGAPRSGTTLLRTAMVTTMGEVYCPPAELQILPTLVKLFRMSRGGPDEFLQAFEGSTFQQNLAQIGIWPPREKLHAIQGATLQQLLPQLIVQIGEQEGRSSLSGYWGDKTPENFRHTNEIVDLWPDARIVHVVRGPTAVVQSMRRAWGRSYLRGASLWQEAALCALRDLATRPKFTRIVRYEDLTCRPEQILSDLADWLDVGLDLTRLADLNTSERWGTAIGQSGILPASGGSSLKPQHRLAIDSVCFNEARLLGYPVDQRATERKVPPIALKLLRIRDGAFVMARYMRERGVISGFRYKWSQWNA